MRWQEVRQAYPHRWVVVEATNAYTEGSKRIANQLNLVGTFAESWKNAWDKYRELHHMDRRREYYIVYTNRPELNIEVMDEFRRPVSK
jgi:hypothetical protein